METVKERSRKSFVVSFKDDNGDLFTPTTARYRLDNEDGTELIAWTAVTAPAGRLIISVPASANRILDNANVREVKTLTVQSDEGTDNQLSEDYTYQVMNLSGFTS